MRDGDDAFVSKATPDAKDGSAGGKRRSTARKPIKSSIVLPLPPLVAVCSPLSASADFGHVRFVTMSGCSFVRGHCVRKLVWRNCDELKLLGRRSVQGRREKPSSLEIETSDEDPFCILSCCRASLPSKENLGRGFIASKIRASDVFPSYADTFGTS